MRQLFFITFSFYQQDPHPRQVNILLEKSLLAPWNEFKYAYSMGPALPALCNLIVSCISQGEVGPTKAALEEVFKTLLHHLIRGKVRVKPHEGADDVSPWLREGD